MRVRSFRSAAEELLVSPQAVGQQIKLLEDALRAPPVRPQGAHGRADGTGGVSIAFGLLGLAISSQTHV